MDDELKALVVLSPGDGRINTLVRQTCGKTLGLPALPAEVDRAGPESDAEAVVAEFAEQFSVDVSAVGDGLRGRLASALGESVLRTVVLVFVADFAPRVRAGWRRWASRRRGPTGRSNGITTAIRPMCCSPVSCRAWHGCAGSTR